MRWKILHISVFCYRTTEWLPSWWLGFASISFRHALYFICDCKFVASLSHNFIFTWTRGKFSFPLIHCVLLYVTLFIRIPNLGTYKTNTQHLVHIQRTLINSHRHSCRYYYLETLRVMAFVKRVKISVRLQLMGIYRTHTVCVMWTWPMMMYQSQDPRTTIEHCWKVFYIFHSSKPQWLIEWFCWIVLYSWQMCEWQFCVCVPRKHPA